MNERRSSTLLVTLALATLAAGLACRHSSTNMSGDTTPAPPCDPPASTAVRDGRWQRTQVYSTHLPDIPCAAPATTVDTLLWVGVDFLSALTDGVVACAPQWACDDRFNVACIDTIDNVGCRYIITAQGSGTFREDSLSGAVLVRVRTSGTCGSFACANNLKLSAVWIAPTSAPLRRAAMGAAGSQRSLSMALGWPRPER